MKAEIKKPQFTPIELRITIETEQEFVALKAIAASTLTITSLFEREEMRTVVNNMLFEIKQALNKK